MVDIRFANEGDIDAWMELVAQVRENFPGLETVEAMEEHRRTVLEFMGRDSAICAKVEGKIVGELLFSREESSLCFLAVAPEYRRRHIGETMVEYADLILLQTRPDRDVTVTTYREGAPGGEAARRFYKNLGFREGELTEEFGTPVQIFVLRR